MGNQETFLLHYQSVLLPEIIKCDYLTVVVSSPGSVITPYIVISVVTYE